MTAKPSLSRRSSGVLLHPTSLPGPRGGTLGAEALGFVDILVNSAGINPLGSAEEFSDEDLAAEYARQAEGTAMSVDPKTGKCFDDTVGLVKSIEWLTDEDRYKVFEGNARKLYSRAKW